MADIVMEEADVLRDALEALLDAREFMGWQLTLAHGEISDETFRSIAEPYFQRQVVLSYGPELIARARILLACLPGRFDADFVSVALRCDFDDALRIVLELRPN